MSKEEEMPAPSESSPSTSGPKMINLNVHKAGLVNLDKEKINKIIQEASKGSNFYSFQQKRQKRIEQQINELKAKLKRISDNELASALLKCDALIVELERFRVLNRIIVHFDMDMFFAAVELRNNPHLADKPVAVGTLSMISTSNYVARKFGVRSAMAGFIAKRLCPQLVLIKPNFKSYSRESEIVMNIIRQYDPNLRCFSLDEVYIDLTEFTFEKYCDEKNIPMEELLSMAELADDVWNLAYDIVNDIRKRVFDETKLTISAGISCNTMLAKVCTDINKPNGQFMVKGDRAAAMDFASSTDLRKFCGIGPVRGQILNAFNIHTGADLYKERAILFVLFSEMNVDYYMRIYLGIGSAHLHTEDVAQKSHSRERTVGKLDKFEDICGLLKSISSKVSRDLKNNSQECKTITLKVKKTTFEVFLKSKTINHFTDDEGIIYSTVRDLLSQEVSKSDQYCYRLIGVKVSNLKDVSETGSRSSQLTLSQHFKNLLKKPSTSEQTTDDDDDERQWTEEEEPQFKCRLCDSIFDDAALLESHKFYCDGDLIEAIHYESHDCEPDSGYEQSGWAPPEIECSINPEPEQQQPLPPSILYQTCPICKLSLVFKSNDDLNSHIDVCLNKDICVELTQIPSTADARPPIVNPVNQRRQSGFKRTSNTGKNSKNKKIKQCINNETIESYFR